MRHASGVVSKPHGESLPGGTDDAAGDQALLLRLHGRDEQALGELYDHHSAAAYGVALRVTGNAELAEEVVQDAFLTVWRRAETYQAERGTVRSWLLRVVHNRAIDVVRARDGRPRVGERQPQARTLDGLVLVAADNPEREVLRAIDGAVVRNALARLPRDQRQVVELAYFGGLAYPEVAAAVGVPLGTVKSRLRLALGRLRTLVGDHLSLRDEPRSVVGPVREAETP